MPLIKLVRGKRYQFSNVIVQQGEVIEVDARTRNRLVKSKHFVDVMDIEVQAFTPLPEDAATAAPVPVAVAPEKNDGLLSGGTPLGANADPAIFGAPDQSPNAGKTIHSRSGSDLVNQRAAEAKAEVPV